jgi:hypothetical protein
MSSRILTVYAHRQRRPRRHTGTWCGVTPRIVLAGAWLAEAGYQPGERIEVTVLEDGSVVIRRAKAG